MRSPTKTIVVISLDGATEIQLTGMYSGKERARWWEHIHDALDAAGMEFAEPLGYPETAVPVGQKIAAKIVAVCDALIRPNALPVAWEADEDWTHCAVGVVAEEMASW